MEDFGAGDGGIVAGVTGIFNRESVREWGVFCVDDVDCGATIRDGHTGTSDRWGNRGDNSGGGGDVDEAGNDCGDGGGGGVCDNDGGNCVDGADGGRRYFAVLLGDIGVGIGSGGFGAVSDDEAIVVGVS